MGNLLVQFILRNSGLEAVIDKDKAGNVLAQSVKADIFLILTDVQHAKINFGKENESIVEAINIKEAQNLYDEGHFLKGSMVLKWLNNRDQK